MTHESALKMALAFVLALVSVSDSDSLGDDSRNQLPKQQHRTSNAPFLKPAEAVAKMSIPDGFEVSIFAAEPDIAEPIAFCFDHRGRMWIAENFRHVGNTLTTRSAGSRFWKTPTVTESLIIKRLSPTS